ncbi:MAG: PhoPQ-activated pathogenicity-related family protein [Candidatus Hydrogenedentes bacterium]|nr:PhoPQ-activated pathogenicity-related family protein [Candidatus Hydrogenedentota bacterium]
MATAYITRMTSQAWRSAYEIYRGRTWQHNLTILVPENLRYSTALLFVDGGSINSSPPDESERLFLGQLAALSGCTVVHLDNVPSQPIVFMDDYDPETNEILYSRSEDAIISYSYDRFMNEYKNGNYDYKWPVLLAMAKSAVRAMDTTQAILGDRAPSKFVISGGSKRGWTTWLAGLTDCRIKAISPLVIDVINMDKQMEHHKKVYGYWAPSIYEYAQMKVFDRLVTEGGLPEEAIELLKIVDPYEYLDRMEDIPKFIMNSSCDEFFVPDSSQWYYDDLPGEKLLNYVPNVSHSLGDDFDIETPAVQNLLAWFLAKSQDVNLPKYRWIRESQNTLRVEVDSAFINSIQEVKLWKCTNPNARDFRKYKLDSLNLRYEEEVLSPISSGVYRVTVPTPNAGWTAYFIQLKFNNPARLSVAIPGVSVPPLVFTTPIFVIPEEYPSYPSERKVVGSYPLLVLRGSPYDIGYSYGNLMTTEIQNHVNYVFANLTNRFGIALSNLNTVWNIQKNSLDERIREELEGIADATGISFDDIGRLQLVELLSIYSSDNNTNIRSSGSTLWSSAINIGSYWGISPIALTYSLNRRLYTNGQQNYPVILFYIPEQGFPHAIMTFAGLVVGRVGVNIAGVSYADIPVLNEVPNENENMLFALRESLYDSNRLEEMVKKIKEESKGRIHKYLLGDGRYEKRGAKIRIDSSGLVLIRDNSTIDEYYPNVKKYVVYTGHNSTTANSIYQYISTNNGPLDLNGILNLTNIGAISSHNLMNIMINATSFSAYVVYASGTSDASTQTYRLVDFQSLLP